MGGRRELFRQRGQDSGPRFKQRDLEPALVEALESVAAKRAGSVVQLGRKLHPGGPAADDGDLHSRIACIACIGCRPGTRNPQAVVQQPLPESLRVLAMVQEHAVGTNARDAEIVRHRAHRHDQVVVGNALASQQLCPVDVVHGRGDDFAALPVDILHGAEEEPKAPAITVRSVPHFVEIGIEGAGRHFMQQRLPDMGPVSVDEKHLDGAISPEPASELRGELEPARATADNDYLCHRVRHARPTPVPVVVRFQSTGATRVAHR